MGRKGCGSGAASLARPGCGFGKADAFPKRGREVGYPAALPTANLRRLTAPPPGHKWKASYCAVETPMWARLEGPLQDTSPSRGRRLTTSGSAAIGVLKTLLLKCEIDSKRGSFLGRRRSCRGPPSQLQVGAFSAHQSAFLSSTDAAHRAEVS